MDIAITVVLTVLGVLLGLRIWFRREATETTPKSIVAAPSTGSKYEEIYPGGPVFRVIANHTHDFTAVNKAYPNDLRCTCGARYGAKSG